MTNTSNKNGKLEESPSSDLPLLYRSPAPLDIEKHGKSAICPSDDFSFAKNTNSIPLNTIEFIEAVKTYPIVFSNGDTPMPIAIVGLEQQNYLLKTNNSWQENSYIPAYIRQYPFIFFERTEEKRFYLCVDEAAPQFSQSGDGENPIPLYKEDGTPTDFTNNALKFCTAFYQHHLITHNFGDDLKKHKLLEPYQSQATLSSGKKAKLSGFQIINEKAFNSLPDKVYLEFREKGWIPFIYFALASTSNWKNLVALEAKQNHSA